MVILVLAFLYVRISVRLLRGDDATTKGVPLEHLPPVLVQPGKQWPAVDAVKSNRRNAQAVQLPANAVTYQSWRDLAVALAGEPPNVVVETLKGKDPFGVRTFERRLLESESERQRFLTLAELQELFPCPSPFSGIDAGGGRITLPDQRDHDKAAAFRNGTVPYFLFFQHLRKAGGE